MTGDPNARLATALFPRLAAEQIGAALQQAAAAIREAFGRVNAGLAVAFSPRNQLVALIRAEQKRQQHVTARMARRRAGGPRVRTTSRRFRAGTRKTRRHSR